jgi:hypothetical protein
MRLSGKIGNIIFSIDGLKTSLSIAGVLLGGALLIVGNLRCVATDIEKGLRIELSPPSVEVASAASHSVEGKVKWIDSDLEAEWSADGSGLKTVLNVNCSPKLGKLTTISFDNAGLQSISSLSDSWLNTGKLGERLPVTARFLDPVIGESGSINRKAYLSLVAWATRVKLEVTKCKVVPAVGSVAKLLLAGNATLAGAPADSRYSFSFQVDVYFLNTSGDFIQANDSVRVGDSALGTVTNPDGKRGNFGEAAINLVSEAVKAHRVTIDVVASKESGSGPDVVKIAKSVYLGN